MNLFKMKGKVKIDEKSKIEKYFDIALYVYKVGNEKFGHIVYRSNRIITEFIFSIYSIK